MIHLCPWSWLTPSTSHFCEAARCAVVREPANTWSNLGFFVAGALMWRSSRDAPRLVRRFGLVCAALGVGSTAFHATGTWLGGIMDSAGMQATAAFMLAANLRRLIAPSPSDDRRDAGLFWAITAAGTLAVIAFESVERRIYLGEMIAASALELMVLYQTRFQPAHRWLGLSWAAFIFAYFLWYRDLHRIGCDPSDHVFNGHAAWHLLMALSLYCVQRFHTDLLRAPGGAVRAAPR